MTETPTELTDAEVLARISTVLQSIAATGRADMRTLRSLPSWPAVQLARTAFRARAITRAELDAIAREAAVLGGVKPDKRKSPGITDAAVEAMCACVYVGWEHASEEYAEECRGIMRRALTVAVDRLDWTAIVPDETELAQIISDPGSVVARRRDESIAGWGARAVWMKIRRKIMG